MNDARKATAVTTKPETKQEIVGTLRIFTRLHGFRGRRVTLARDTNVTEGSARFILQEFREMNGLNIKDVQGVWQPNAVKL